MVFYLDCQAPVFDHEPPKAVNNLVSQTEFVEFSAVPVRSGIRGIIEWVKIRLVVENNPYDTGKLNLIEY